MREEIVRASRLKIRVLIAGESGTGKELVARALHEESPRRDEKFVVLSGAEGTDELFDSKLFGYEKGAFTGAASRRIGRYELADRGTLFIDEIGKMPLVQQAKLLRVIESGSFERMGGLDTLEKDTRVISASNEDLEGKVASGAFLDDLLYRIQEYRIDVPPLRKRLEDLPELADALIKRFARLQGLEDTALVQGALDPLYDYEWPGNVRELESILKVATLYSKDGVITEDAIATSLRQHRRRRGSRPSLAEETGDRVRLENVRETRKDAGERTLAEFAHGPYTEARESVLEAFDRLFVLRALASAGGNCAAATRAMGLSRSTSIDCWGG
ncbi:MAG: sigma-54-dependent Fis family transcriptional regulator [Acidobacteria bacterium]|nr:sigma-54-dependent Fis family transcriptional regulator [Acidobacteriota bacterium]